MILVVTLYFFLALAFVIAKTTLTYASPFFLIGVRMICAGLALIGYHLIRNQGQLNIPRAHWPLFIKTALFHIYFAFVLEFWSLQYLSASTTNILYSSTPFISALLSFMLLGSRLSRKQMIGMALGLGGLTPVIFSQSSDMAITGPMPLLPTIVLFIAITSAAYAWFLVKALMEHGYSLPLINGIAMLVGGLGALATSAATEGLWPLPISNIPAFFGWLILLILIANVVVYNLYGMLLRTYSITFLSFAGFLCPLFGGLLAWAFRSEPISLGFVTSLITVVIALYIFYQDELIRT